MANDMKIGAGIALDGEKEFKAAVASINRELKVLQSEAKKNSIVYSDNANEMKKLRAQSETMTAQVRDQKTKIDLLNSALENAEKEFGYNSRQVQSWQIQLNNAEGALFKMKKALDENDEALSKLRKNQLTGSLKQLNDVVEAVRNKFNPLKNIVASVKEEFGNVKNTVESAKNIFKGSKSSIDDMGDGLEKAGKKGLSFGDSLKANVIGDVITSGLKKIGSLIGQIAQKFGDFVKDGIQNASDLAEVQNVVDTTFGESADAIDAFAKSAAASYGMSELSAKKYSGTMGAMLKSMGIAEDEVASMSTAMVGLAGDMASFYNLDHEEAFNKIRSGISGETEPLKQLGINMSVANLNAFALSQGIGKTYDSMTQSEQATLRYNYLMQATADAQGDFARTSDSFANQQKILKLNMENLATSIGSKVVPFLTQGTSAINGMLSGTMSLEDGMAALSGVLKSAIDSLVEQLPSLLAAGSEIVVALVTGILDNIDQIIVAAVDMITTLTDTLLEDNTLGMIISAAVTLVVSLVEALGDNIDKIIDAAFTIVDSLVNALLEEDNLTKLIGAAIKIVIEVVAGLIESVPKLHQAAKDLIVGLVNGLWENRGLVVEKIKKVGAALLDALKSFFGIHSPSTVFAGLGKNLLEGLWNGISNMKNWLVKKIKSLGSTVTEALKSVLGIHSPSTVFRDQIGKNLALGVGVGFEDTMKNVSKKMMNAIPMNVDINATSSTKTPIAGISVSINIENFNNNRTEDIRALAGEISEMLAMATKRREAAYA